MQLRKIAVLVIMSAVLFCAGAAHADGTQQLTLNLSSGGLLASQVTTDYILTIPDDFEVYTKGWNSIGQLNVKVSQDKVFTGNAVVVTAESTNSFSMKDGDNSISYTLKTSESDSGATTSFTFASADINASTSGASQDLGISITWESSQPAGTYTDTITYTAAVEGAASAWDGDLSALTAESTAEYATATNGMTITGTLGENVQISIADGATVTLSDVTINGTRDSSYRWAGITCEGDATIILSGDNTVRGFWENYPGIFISPDYTLTIKGSGSLNASSNGYGAGIGGGYKLSCGNIEIQDGNITATGGQCAAGIGGGQNSSCGNITITTGVTSVTATKGFDAPCSIGKGGRDDASCGTVTIGGTVYWDGSNYQNGGDTYLTTSPLTYTPSGS